MTPRFRVNPEVEIVPWRELHAGEQEQLRRLTGQSAVPAILRPKPGAQGTIKMVDEDFLRLLDSLRTPAAVPGCAALCGMPRFLKLSVLDGILEVEIGGQFVSGPAAAGLVEDVAFESLPADRIAELSLEALRYAAALPVMEARALSSRLYGYNSIPCGTKWKSALGTPENIADLLGLGVRGQNHQALAEQGYDAVEHPQWLAWTRRTDWETGARAGIKLYISPRPECLLTVFARRNSGVGPQRRRVGEDWTDGAEPAPFGQVRCLSRKRSSTSDHSPGVAPCVAWIPSARRSLYQRADRRRHALMGSRPAAVVMPGRMGAGGKLARLDREPPGYRRPAGQGAESG